MTDVRDTAPVRRPVGTARTTDPAPMLAQPGDEGYNNPLEPRADGTDPVYPEAEAQDRAEALAADREQRAEARRTQFESEQAARAAEFDRSEKAAATKFEHDAILAAETDKRQAAILANEAENDKLAYSCGLLSDADLAQHVNYLAPHHDYVMPHDALLADEATVKMAFPQTVTLTRSPSDIRTVDPRFDSEYANEEGRQAILPVGVASRILFRKGVRDVPLHLADHDWLASNGAYRVKGDGAPMTAEEVNASRRSDADKVQELDVRK